MYTQQEADLAAHNYISSVLTNQPDIVQSALERIANNASDDVVAAGGTYGAGSTTDY